MSEFSCVVRNVRNVNAEMARIDVQAGIATVAALKAMQAAAKKNIRSGMRGRPRWDSRGTGRTGEGVNLHLSPRHVNKTGGPGRLTGHLSAAVGGVRRPKIRGNGVYVGGVGAGGKGQNLYKRQVEGKFPYIRPGVDKTVREAEPIWAKAWGRAIK